jgi:putative transposase
VSVLNQCSLLTEFSYPTASTTSSPVDERHLRAILAEYSDYYNRDRPHRSLQLETPRPQLRPRAGPSQSVRTRPVLNGLHHVYQRAA